MIRLLQTWRALRRDARGATIVEFGLILVPLCVILLGTLDLGYTSYLNSVVQGTLHEASREATLGNKRGDEIDALVKSRLSKLVHAQYVTITKKSYAEFGRIAQPEKLKKDVNKNGQYDAPDGDCYEDFNDDGYFNDGTAAGAATIGGAEQVLFYEVSVNMPHITPIGKFLGWSGMNQVKSNTVIRNQPYANVPLPRERCGP